MRQLYIILLFFVYNLTVFSQACDKKAILKRINKLEKKYSPSKTEEIYCADSYFELGECNMAAADTNYKSNFLKAIHLYKKLFNRDPSSEKKIKCIFKVGLSYFHLNDCSNALIYFDKAAGGKYLNPEAVYYKGASLVCLNKCREAEKEFKTYIQMTNDTLRVKNILTQCKSLGN